jgi:hypothetical protein
MVDTNEIGKHPLLVGWLVSAGLLVAILLLNRCLFWLYGFPVGLVAFMVTVAAIGIVMLIFLMVRRYLPDWLCAPPWLAFRGWQRRLVVLYWLVWGWLMAAFFELHDRIEQPTLSYLVTVDDVVDALIFGTIVGGFMALFVLGQLMRRRETVND